VATESFGDEGLIGTGLSLDWMMPALWADTNELTVEVMNAGNEVAFAGEDWRHPSVLARLKSYWDLSPDSYLELGLNGLHGTADADGRLDHDLFALDLTYSWYPAGRELYREVTVRGMLLYSDLALSAATSHQAWGGYVEPKPGIPPAARHVADLIERIKAEHIRVLLAADYFEASKPELIAARTGIEPVIMPTSVGGESGVDTHFDLVDTWIERLRTAFMTDSSR